MTIYESEQYDARQGIEEGSRSAYGDLQRESERLMKTVEVLGVRLAPVLIPESEEANQVSMSAIPLRRSELGGLVDQYRKSLGAIDRIIKRIEL